MSNYNNMLWNCICMGIILRAILWTENIKPKMTLFVNCHYAWPATGTSWIPPFREQRFFSAFLIHRTTVCCAFKWSVNNLLARSYYRERTLLWVCDTPQKLCCITIGPVWKHPKTLPSGCPKPFSKLIGLKTTEKWLLKNGKALSTAQRTLHYLCYS